MKYGGRVNNYECTLFRLLFFSMALLLAVPSACYAWPGKVIHVADGDTISVERNGKVVKIRLYGIDTPEKSQWYGQNAKAFTSAQVMGKIVDIEKIDIDRYRRVVGIVTIGNLVLNRHLLKYGYAWVYYRYCNKPFCSEWTMIEAEARKAKRRKGEKGALEESEGHTTMAISSLKEKEIIRFPFPKKSTCWISCRLRMLGKPLQLFRFQNAKTSPGML